MHIIRRESTEYAYMTMPDFVGLEGSVKLNHEQHGDKLTIPRITESPLNDIVNEALIAKWSMLTVKTSC